MSIQYVTIVSGQQEEEETDKKDYNKHAYTALSVFNGLRIYYLFVFLATPLSSGSVFLSPYCI